MNVMKQLSRRRHEQTHTIIDVRSFHKFLPDKKTNVKGKIEEVNETQIHSQLKKRVRKGSKKELFNSP
jgi:site-specific recombinase XerD